MQYIYLRHLTVQLSQAIDASSSNKGDVITLIRHLVEVIKSHF